MTEAAKFGGKRHGEDDPPWVFHALNGPVGSESDYTHATVRGAAKGA
jgi:hypothetical protein